MNKYKFRVVGPLLLLLLFLLIYGHTVYRQVFHQEKVATDNQAPNFLVRDIEGELVELSDYRGKGVLLNFWATYCPPCEKEMPYMEKAYQEYKNQGVEILAVNSSEPTRIVQQFLSTQELSFPILLDRDGAVVKKYNILTLPVSFLINEEGEIVDQISGEMTEENVKIYMERIKP